MQWTEDHQYLTFAGENEKVAYVYKLTGGSYQEVVSNGEFHKAYGKEVRYLSFDLNNKLLVASTETGLDLYSGFDEGNATLEQTLDQGNFVITHSISPDGRYLISGLVNIKVYRHDASPQCNIGYCTRCSNSTHCEHCNQLVDYFLNETTGSC